MRQDWYNLLRKKKNLADLISIKLADSCFYICMEMHYQLKEVLRIWSLTETYFLEILLFDCEINWKVELFIKALIEKWGDHHGFFQKKKKKKKK